MKTKRGYWLWLLAAGIGVLILPTVMPAELDTASKRANDAALRSGLLAVGWIGLSFLIVWLSEWAILDVVRARRARHLEEESRSDDPEAMYRLAVAYESGSGVEEDMSKAYRLYHKAGKLGHRDAAYEAAICLMQGKGVSTDFVTARSILAALAATGDEAASHRLAEIDGLDTT